MFLKKLMVRKPTWINAYFHRRTTLDNNLVAWRLINSDSLRWLHDNHVWIICCGYNLLISIRYNTHRLTVHQYSLRLRDSRNLDRSNLARMNRYLLTSSLIFVQFWVKKANYNPVENWHSKKCTKIGSDSTLSQYIAHNGWCFNSIWPFLAVAMQGSIRW